MNWRLVIALAMILTISVVDVFSRHLTIAILFAIPLVFLALSGYVRLMWAATLSFVVMTYAQYFLRYSIHPPEIGPAFASYRLVNRSMLAGMICLLGLALDFWVRATEQMPPPASESLPRQQSEQFHAMRRSFDAMLAYVIFPVLLIVIAFTDLSSPANFNFPILYVLPLFVCAWTRNRAILWCVLATVLMLSVAGFVFGPPPSQPSLHPFMKENRYISASVSVIVTVMLHVWITVELKKKRAVLAAVEDETAGLNDGGPR